MKVIKIKWNKKETFGGVSSKMVDTCTSPMDEENEDEFTFSSKV
jgi:hypothetical protein